MIQIADGNAYAEFNININNDDDYEDSETFYVTIDPLSLPYGVTLGSNAYAEVTIMDDDCKWSLPIIIIMCILYAKKLACQKSCTYVIYILHYIMRNCIL